MVWIAIVVGALLGGAWGDSAFGAFVGASIGWLLWRSHRQQAQIAALERALLNTAGHAAAPIAVPSAAQSPQAGDQPVVARKADAPGLGAAPAPAPVAQGAEPAAWPANRAAAVPAGEAGVPPSEQAAGPDAEGTADIAVPPSLPPLSPSVSAPPPAPRADPFAAIRAWLFGGNTIVKAGVGILFIGLAFLAKYATEHVQVPVELRLAGIGGVALVLLAIGWRLRIRRAQYAQVLQGGAIAVMYLTLFAAFKFYAVLTVGPAFALMVVVAMLAAALAVLQDARALAVIGAIGGFATPLLVSSGSGNYIALFSYYLVLDLGIAAVAWHKTWRSLNLIGFAATFLVATAWGVLDYRPDRYASSQAFLIAFFVVFVAIMLMPARRAAAHLTGQAPTLGQRADGWVNGTLLFGLPTVSFALQYGLVRDTAYGVALSALVLAAFYVLLAMAMRSRPALAVPFEGTLAVGTVFLTLVIPFALDERSTAGAWALEGAGLIWLGWRQSRGISRVFGYTLLLLAGLAMLSGYERHGDPTGIFNAYLFSGLMAAAASLAAALFVARHAPQGRAAGAGEALAEPLLIGWGTLWLLATASLQIDTFVDAPWRLNVWVVVLSGVAALDVLLATRLRWRQVSLPAIGHAPLLGLAAAMTAAWFASPLEHGGWWAWPIAIGVHVWVLRQGAPGWPRGAQLVVHTAGLLVLAGLGALEGSAITRAWGDADSAWPWLGWLALPAALLMLLPRASVAARWPVRALPQAYLTIGAGVLACGALLWTLLANLASDGSAHPLPHVPLLNPLDLGVAFALLATVAWLRSPGAAAFAIGPAARAALVGGVAFVWLNAILVRGFHHYAGVPYRFDAWTQSLPVQTGITLLWTITALVLMWLSARRAASMPTLAEAARAAWMVGAGLLAAVVLKLVLVDLSGSGTVTRIVSFIGVGVLMLVIGYVAPLPGKTKEETNATA